MALHNTSLPLFLFANYVEYLPFRSFQSITVQVTNVTSRHLIPLTTEIIRVVLSHSVPSRHTNVILNLPVPYLPH